MARTDSLSNMSVSVSASLSDRELLRLQTFTPHLGREFDVQRGGEWLSVALTEASPGHRHQPGKTEVFSLIFTAGPEQPLQQGIHDFRHPELGAFELFITPVMPKPGAAANGERFYEAVINRDTGI
jgi:hypothetical protein